jgi:hypothetical protein
MTGDGAASMLSGSLPKGIAMKQIRITKPRRRATEAPEPLPMDPRDPEIVRAKQLAARRRHSLACAR